MCRRCLSCKRPWSSVAMLLLTHNTNWQPRQHLATASVPNAQKDMHAMAVSYSRVAPASFRPQGQCNARTASQDTRPALQVLCAHHAMRDTTRHREAPRAHHAPQVAFRLSQVARASHGACAAWAVGARRRDPQRPIVRAPRAQRGRRSRPTATAMSAPRWRRARLRSKRRWRRQRLSTASARPARQATLAMAAPRRRRATPATPPQPGPACAPSAAQDRTRRR